MPSVWEWVHHSYWIIILNFQTQPIWLSVAIKMNGDKIQNELEQLILSTHPPPSFLKGLLNKVCAVCTWTKQLQIDICNSCYSIISYPFTGGRITTCQHVFSYSLHRYFSVFSNNSFFLTYNTFMHYKYQLFFWNFLKNVYLYWTIPVDIIIV